MYFLSLSAWELLKTMKPFMLRGSSRLKELFLGETLLTEIKIKTVCAPIFKEELTFDEKLGE